jgi:hypothetical protein
VAAGEDGSVMAPAGTFQTKFKKELTRKIDLLLQYTANVTTRESGSFSHHAEMTLKFDVTRLFDVNLSFIWDRIENPHAEPDGSSPRQDDYRLNAGIGWKF